MLNVVIIIHEPDEHTQAVLSGYHSRYLVDVPGCHVNTSEIISVPESEKRYLFFKFS